MSKFKNVKIKRGTFYLSSKTQEDDSWERQEFTIKDEDIVVYHKELSMEGNLNKVELYDDRFVGNCLRISLKGFEDGNFYILDIPIINKNSPMGATNEYFQSAVGALGNIELGDPLTIFVNNRNRDKNDRLYRNLVFLDDDSKLIKSNYMFSDVPGWEKIVTKDKLTGKEEIKWNPEEANDFFFDRTKEIIDRLSKKNTGDNKESKVDFKAKSEEKAEEDKEASETKTRETKTSESKKSGKVKPKTAEEAFNTKEDKKVKGIASTDLPF